MIERGRQIEIYVKTPGTIASYIFVTRDGKEAVARASALHVIPATPNFMTTGKWDVQPPKPR